MRWPTGPLRRTPVLIAAIVILLGSASVAAAKVTGLDWHGVLDDVVVRPLLGHRPPAVTVSATPARQKVDAGDTATVVARVGRRHLSGPVQLSVSGLPAGSSASVSPNPVGGDTETVRITVGRDLSTGSRVVTITARAKDRDGQWRTASTAVVLGVEWHSKGFGIAGDATGLAPGVVVPLDLRLTNPDRSAIAVSGVRVTIRDVVRAPGVSMPCSVSDYTIGQYAGSYPLTVPGHSTRSLSALGVPVASRPKLTMLDRPVNQDGCKGARLILAYTGSAHGTGS